MRRGGGNNPRRWVTLRAAPEWVAAVLGIAALGVGCAVYWRESERTVYHLTLTAGRTEGLRNKIALRLADAAARRRVVLKIVPTKTVTWDHSKLGGRY